MPVRVPGSFEGVLLRLDRATIDDEAVVVPHSVDRKAAEDVGLESARSEASRDLAGE
jgi:hypothetical protein